jgi:chromosome segregation ATPase
MIDQVRQRELDLMGELEEVKRQVRRVSYDKQQLESKIENLNTEIKNLDLERKEKDKEIGELNLKLNEDQSKTMHSEQKLTQNEIEILDLQKIISDEKREKTIAVEELKDVERKLDDEKVKCKKLGEQIEILKSLVSNLDKTKEELVERIKQNTQTQKLDAKEKEQFLIDTDGLKKDTIAKDREISALKQSLKELDQRNDQLQAHLDTRTEELQHLNNILNHKVFFSFYSSFFYVLAF